MAYVSKDQLERARQIPVIDYILRYESGNIKQIGGEYRLHDHTSLSIGEKGWFWHSRGIGAKSALDFLIEVRGYGLVNAVCLLLGEQPQRNEHPMVKPAGKSPKLNIMVEPKPLPERPTFSLPRHNMNNNRVIAYLQSRGIDKRLILDCINQGNLFESAYRHDCIFKGKDENGITRYAAVRSTLSGFKGDVEGSDKKYSFLLPPTDLNSNTVAVYESPIDALSGQTMCIEGHIPDFDGWRLSLGGTSVLGLEQFLKNNPKVTLCLICTDDDIAGNSIAARIAKLSGITTERLPPPIGKDWNDALAAMQKAKRTNNRAQISARCERG